MHFDHLQSSLSAPIPRLDDEEEEEELPKAKRALAKKEVPDKVVEDLSALVDRWAEGEEEDA